MATTPRIASTTTSSLANLSLSADPLTGNRYDLAGGNPISYMERRDTT
jgi:hypothetical protein